MKTIDDIIKQAVVEAGLKPSGNGKERSNVKSASDGSVADRLYLLADELEKMGDVPIGGGEKKARANNSLRQLAKTFIYQQNLKQASADRMGVEDSADIEKLAAYVEARDAYLDAFEKKAKKLRVNDIEDSLGVYLSDKKEDEVRDLIARKYDESFVLRHPWLTGIPTLGIAPAYVKSREADDIGRVLMRRDPKLKSEVDAKRRQNTADYLALTKAEQPQRVAESVSTALGALKSSAEKRAGKVTNFLLAVGGAGKATGRAVGNFPKKHPYVSMGIGAAGGIPIGEWMGKNVGAMNLTDAKYPAEAAYLDKIDDEYMQAYLRKDKATMKALGPKIDEALSRYKEKYKAVRSQM